MHVLRRTAVSQYIFGYLLATILATCATFTFLYFTAIPTLEKEARAHIYSDIAGVEARYSAEGIKGAAQYVEELVQDDANADAAYLLMRPGSPMMVGNLESWPHPLPTDGQWHLVLLKRIHDSEPVLMGVNGVQLENGYHLVAGRDMSVRVIFIKAFLQAFVVALVLMIVITLSGGYLLARFLLRRVKAITATAENIMQGDLSRRIQRSGSFDEFDQLAKSLNAMLTHIDHLITTTRSATDSIAHDFRSPLTRLKTRLEVTLNRKHTEEELRTAAGAALGEIDDLLRTLNSLLEIVRAEGKVSREQMKTVDMEALVRDIGELYLPLAENKGVSLIVNADERLKTHGHSALLAQALSNLVDNAIKYSPPGTVITITAALGPAGPFIAVADQGPGIPEDRQDDVLERFVRLDSSRSTPGAGLGLSLVAAVAKQHDATLTLHDNHPGLRVVMRFVIRATR